MGFAQVGEDLRMPFVIYPESPHDAGMKRSRSRPRETPLARVEVLRSKRRPRPSSAGELHRKSA